MKTIEIHGKKYVTVNERVKYLRENHKEYSIVTDIVQASDQMAIVKCTIFNGETIVSTGHAFEVVANKGINKTSHLENCETSAVGRALGFLGIGIDGGIASLDEIIQASTSEYIQKLMMSRSVSDEDREKIEDNLLTMTAEDANRVIKYLQAHQLDPITQGAGYNQTDIQKKLDQKDLQDD